MSDPSEIVQLARSMLSAYDEDNRLVQSQYRRHVRYVFADAESCVEDLDRIVLGLLDARHVDRVRVLGRGDPT